MTATLHRIHDRVILKFSAADEVLYTLEFERFTEAANDEADAEKSLTKAKQRKRASAIAMAAIEQRSLR